MVAPAVIIIMLLLLLLLIWLQFPNIQKMLYLHQNTCHKDNVTILTENSNRNIFIIHIFKTQV